MNQKEEILNLLGEDLLSGTAWAKIAYGYLTAADTKPMEPAGGQINARDALATNRVRSVTTQSAGIETYGLTEAIERFEKLDPETRLACYLFSSSDMVGKFYVQGEATNRKLVAGILVKREQSRHGTEVGH